MKTLSHLRGKLTFSLSLAVVLALLVAPLALADLVTSDVDFVNIGNQTLINLGPVSPGQIVSTSTSFQLVCSGSKHVDSGDIVTVQYHNATIPASGALSAGTATIGPIPATWPADTGGSSNCSSPAEVLEDNGNSNVTITAPTPPGLYDFVVTYKVATGGGVDPAEITANVPSVTFRLTVVAGDTTPPVISYVLNPTSPDGNNGWYKSNVTLTWTVSEPDTPSTLVKTGCVDQNITSDQAVTTYSCSATSAGGSAGPVSVSIKRDATAPNVTVTPDRGPDYNGWYNAPVTFDTNGTDATSDIDSCDSDEVYSSPDGTVLTVSGSCTDNAGNSATGTSAAFDYDATAPNVTVTPDRAPDHNGWYNAPVTFDTNGTDATSDIDSCDSDEVYSSPDGTVLTVSGSCTDNAGNSATGTSAAFDYDATAPNVTVTPDRAPDHNGWYNAPVTFDTNGTDATSDIDSCDSDEVYSSPDGTVLTVSGSCTDNAGNSATGTSAAFDYDATAPTLAPVVVPNPVVLNGSATATPNASDGLSGLDSQSCGPVVTSSVGPKSVSCTATDNAGNTAFANANYSVIYSWAGFFRPVDNLPIFNQVKAGQAIPVKFSLSGNQGLDIFAAGYPKSGVIACTPTGTVDTIEETVTAGGSSLSYDASADQYIYVWKTEKGWTGCRQLVVKLVDGKEYFANFKFTK